MRCHSWVLALVLFVVSAAVVRAADMRDLALARPDGAPLLYGLSVPDDYRDGEELPLVVALHPGGQRMRYYGSAYARLVVVPALADLRGIIVAPDCPSNAWTDAAAEQAVLQVIDHVSRTYRIDRRRVLVTGYSMGGRGTWFMASHHPDLFTAAIPMAASTGGEPAASLATMPTYIIHSRRDEVVPFGPAEANAQLLQRFGRPVRFEALSEPTHFAMAAYVPALRRAAAWVLAQWNATPQAP